MKNRKMFLEALLCFVLAVALILSAVITGGSPMAVVLGQSSDITISSSTTWAPGKYTYSSIIITNSSILTLEGSVTVNCVNLTIDPGSSISADGKGYPSDQGPGAGNTDRTGGGSCSGYQLCSYGSGGGHGGYGGKGAYPNCAPDVVDGGAAYGSMLHPTALGSGGGGNAGGAGGGAIRINIAGTLAVNGVISANGANGTSWSRCGRSGGGSGGSIYVTTNTISGSGSINANGGDGYLTSGGGGAGGRVAIYHNTNTFTGTIMAHGGAGYQMGGAGTVFLKSPEQEHGSLRIDNDNHIGAITPLEVNYPLDDIEIVNMAYVSSFSGLTSDSVTIADGATLAVHDSGLTSDSVTIADGATLAVHGIGTITAAQLSLEQNSALIGKTQFSLHTSDLFVKSSSILVGNVNLSTINLTIDPGSSISADGKGYPSDQGPGAGNTGQTGAGSCSGYQFCTYGSGGGHGGYGGKGAYPSCHGQVVDGGAAYGSMLHPTALGSGGGGNAGGAGGGAIRINIAGTLAVNGVISANGANGTSWSRCGRSGGGSGGSIYVTTNTISGSGSINANGGDGYLTSGGGGAGGRVAIYYNTNTFTGTIMAHGGAGYQTGGVGTTVVELGGPSEGPPVARASDISHQPEVMYPDTEYTVTAKYFDPDGREDLKYCYLQLRHPDKPLTMMWVQATDDFWVYAGEEGENYLTAAGTSTDIEEGGLQGYQLAWTYNISDQWPEVEDAIDYGVYAWDDSDLKTGWNYDNTKASFRLAPTEVGHVVLIESLGLTHGPYIVGDTLTANFTVRNIGSVAITLDKLLLGGRYNGGELPGGGFPDFTYQTVTLQPGQTHDYEGTFTIPGPGTYDFFIAYYIENPTEAEKQFLDEHNWNTCIDLGPGLTDADRTRQISVLDARTYRVAYIPVVFPDEKASLSITQLKERASRVEEYFHQQSYGQVVVDSEFIVNDDGGHILHPAEYKTFDHFAAHEQTPRQLAKLLLEIEDENEIDEQQRAELEALADHIGNWDHIYARSVFITVHVLRLETVDIRWAWTNTDAFIFDDYDAVVILQPPRLAPWYEERTLGFRVGELAYTSQQEGLFVWAHELGHALFGWSDYRGDAKHKGDIRFWCLMGGAGWTPANPPPMVMSYNKVEAGWLDYAYASPRQEITMLYQLAPGDYVYTYRPTVGDVDYFIFEGRHPAVEQTVCDPFHGSENKLFGDRGVMIYTVMDNGKVFFVGPQSLAAWRHSLSFTMDDHSRVTLVPGDVYVYEDLPSEREFTLKEENSTLYLEINPYRLPDYTYLTITDVAIVSQVPTSDLITVYMDSRHDFDVSLQAFTVDGRMVGPDYDALDYRFEIEGAKTSGPILGGGPEWIAVPDHEEVYFVIDPTLARKWAEELGINPLTIEVQMKAGFYDSDGNKTEVDPITVTIGLDRPLYLTVEDGEIRLLADVGIDPDVINLSARGRWLTAYIELQDGFDVHDVDTSSVRLAYGGQEVTAEWGDVQDGVLMVKFDWVTVVGWFAGLHGEEVELTVIGDVNGISFQGTDTIRVINR